MYQHSAFLFGFLLLAFSCVHGYYILTNTTTIESISDRPYYLRVDFDRSGYSHQIVATDIGEKLWGLGYAANWRSVMGNSVAGWFCKLSHILYAGYGSIFLPTVTNSHLIQSLSETFWATGSLIPLILMYMIRQYVAQESNPACPECSKTTAHYQAWILLLQKIPPQLP